MNSHLFSSAASFDALASHWTDQPLAYLALAAILMVVALRLIKRAFVPIAVLARVAAAAAVATLAAGAALGLLAVAIAAIYAG